MAPFDFSSIVGTLPYYLIYAGIGLFFGAVLEMSGFGDSRKLAAQFYLKDLTVFKVMFTAIVVACVLIFAATSFGLLEFSRVWVNPTYMVPGIVGGLIMGVGFIVGGFCPGTSLVASATLKIDGIAFVGGVGLGTLLFGETAGLLGTAKNATFMGRFTLDELFGLPTGVAVVLLITMALVMFYGAELAERHFGRGEKIDKKSLIPSNKKYMLAAGALFSASVFVAFMGQPQAEEKWEALAAESKISLRNRDPYVHPMEVVEWLENPNVYVGVFDARSESDFNKFHLLGSKRITVDDIFNTDFIKSVKANPDNSLVFVISNGEKNATAVWKILTGEGVVNVYIVEGGINNWLKTYPPYKCVATPITGRDLKPDQLAWSFSQSVGADCFSAHPDAKFKKRPTDCYLETHPELKRTTGANRRVAPDAHGPTQKPKFKRKVKMKTKAAVKGGCS